MRSCFAYLVAFVMSALPLSADPLPQGSFVIGSYLWQEGQVPRTISLDIQGNDLTLILSSGIALDWALCDQEGDCIYETIAATATASVEDGRLVLTDIQIDEDAVIDPGAPEPTHQTYTARAIGTLQGARFAETDIGFSLDTGVFTMPVFSASSEVRWAIEAYPLAMEISIVQLATCEIRALAPLFSRSDLSAGEAAFRDAVTGFGHLRSLEAARIRQSPVGAGLTEDSLETGRILSLAMALPALISYADGPLGPDLIEAFWASSGQPMFRNNRVEFDNVVAGYGDTLMPLVAFLRHIRDTTPDFSAPASCADPSFGFIAAQGG